ncbi:uncharacterized protein G2W53_044485 [Senna tora]|uniref:Uncharacterized protein n=1 Tax=Senna tora TaxID=362788 RepID=A0A834SHF5_9FABA|nr:uncharacterized protein G2W53_044485 [Senna tora]
MQLAPQNRKVLSLKSFHVSLSPPQDQKSGRTIADVAIPEGSPSTSKRGPHSSCTIALQD